MNSFSEEFTTDSFYIKLQPIRNNSGKWEGEIDISAIIHDDNGLETEELGDMLQVVNMMCASIKLYEDDDEIRERASAIVETSMNNPDSEYMFGSEQPKDNKPTITTEGNVVTLNFKND